MDDALPRHAEADLFVGRTIEGKYRVEELLGWGAMGSVYRARQVALDRTVALKVMSPELAKDPGFVARFHREAKTASRLWHPNTVSVTDFGEAVDGLLYLVMELVPGRNLDEIIQHEFPLGEARVVNIVSQVLSAVAAAHDLGIVHRDLKPENLLVVRGFDDDGAPSDTVKVCDFGLARGLGIDVEDVRVSPPSSSFGPKLTSVGIVLGTPAYMSPEQAAGLVPETRSDIYAVGAILFEMLTKQVPFERSTAHETVAAHLSDPPRDPRDIVRDCSPALAALCVRALAKDPSERPGTARAMRAALQRALTHREETTFPSLEPGRADSTHPSVPSFRQARPSEIRAASPDSRTTASEVPMPDPDRGARPRRWPVVLGLGLGLAGAGAAGFLLARSAPAAPAAHVENMQTHPAVSAEPTRPPPAPSPAAVTAEPIAPAVGASDVHRSPRSPGRAASSPRLLAASVAFSATASPPPPPPATAPPPVEAPPPVTVAAPEPPRVTAPVSPPPAVTYAPDHASVVVGVGDVSGTSRATVGALVAHVVVTDCYQSALRTLGRPEGGQGTMHVDIDEDGVVTACSVTLPPALSSAAACFRSRMLRQRLGRPPDTGSASGDLVIKLVP